MWGLVGAWRSRIRSEGALSTHTHTLSLTLPQERRREDGKTPLFLSLSLSLSLGCLSPPLCSLFHFPPSPQQFAPPRPRPQSSVVLFVVQLCVVGVLSWCLKY